MSEGAAEVSVVPIGVARTPFDAKAEAPRQPRAAEGTLGRIELFEGHHYEDALEGIEEWDHLWVIFLFDRAHGWKPKVQPPRSARKRGVFGTRAPRRPNPIGLSVVRLRSVEGLTLHVSDVDLLDGTPILDLKPYVPWCDAIPDASQGWLERPEDPGPRWVVTFEPLAAEQLAFLAAEGQQLRDRIADHLSLGPHPHAYRRIKKRDDGYVLKVTEWRAHFRVDGDHVHVQRLESGYRRRDRPPLHERFTAAFEPPTDPV